MAKNVLSDTSYRKLKIEDYDANAFHGEDDEAEEVEGPNESRVKQLMQTQQHVELLRELIKNIPLKSKNQQLKDRAACLAGLGFSCFKFDDISKALSQLTIEEVDIVLHYVYRAFDFVGEPQSCSAGILIMFQSAIFKITGYGGILRVLYSMQHLRSSDDK